ncbi:MAG TPA: rod shape-determining protein MreC [Candidatus Paceibacterota bacterium]|jgi:cell shape-determining protein MreC
MFSSAGKFLAAVVGVLVLFALLLRLLAPGALISIVAPLWSAGDVLTDRAGQTVPYPSRGSLMNERDKLLAEVEKLRNENAVLSARASDFERLLGGRTERVGGVLAGVLARPPVAPYDVLVVDQGAGQGVAVGNPSFGPGGVPLGTVTEANPRTSRVTLYSETGRVTEGWAGEARIPLKLTGTGAGGFDAEVSGTSGIAAGDQVYVAGPGALPIGTIVEVVTDPSSPTVVLRIRPTVNPFSLTWVTILGA